MKENHNTKISKHEKLAHIFEIIKKHNISNYEISQNTGISEAGLGSITNKITKNPREITVNAIYDFLLSKYSDSTIPKQISPNKEVDTVDFIELNEEDSNKEVIVNAFGNRFEKLSNGEYLMYMPLFEWDVAASLLDNEGDTRHPDYAEIEQHVTIVSKPLQGKYTAFRIKGGSMEGTEFNKYIPDGSIVWGRELQRLHWESQLRINKFPLWVIGSTDFGRPTLKEIVKHNVEEATVIVDSWNPSTEYAHNVKVSLNTVKMLYYIMKVESSVSDVY